MVAPLLPLVWWTSTLTVHPRLAPSSALHGASMPRAHDLSKSRLRQTSMTALETSARVTLYKLEDGRCGQATVASEIAPLAQQFAGLIRGDCPSIGYSRAASATTLQVPILGSIRVSLYDRG